MATTARAAELVELAVDLPVGVLVTDPGDLADYRSHPMAAAPLAVVRPVVADHVRATADWARRHGITVLARGAGSHGGGTSADGCVVVSTEQMTRIALDTDTGVLVAEAGAPIAQVRTRAAAAGLRLPLDPAGDGATVGGTLAGERWAARPETVLAVTRTSGIVTEVAFALERRRPDDATVMAQFPTATHAASVAMLVAAAADPAVVTVLDRTTLDDAPPARGAAASVLLVACHGGGNRTRLVEHLVAVNGATTIRRSADAAAGELLLGAPAAVLASLHTLGTGLPHPLDVPVTRLAEFAAAARRVEERRGVTVTFVARARDGLVHPFVLDSHDDVRAQAALAELSDVSAFCRRSVAGHA